MLTRAARRRHALRHFQQAAEQQLHLPWLCPALAQPATGPFQRRSIASRPSISRSRTSPLPLSQSRHLASPATVPEYFDGDEYIPSAYDHGDRVIAQRPLPSRNMAKLDPFDLSRLLMLDSTTAIVPERVQPHRRNPLDLSGDIDEFEATLHACLNVHLWDRSFNLLDQMQFFRDRSPKKLLDAHNDVLAAMIDDALRTGSHEHHARINGWIEVTLRNAGLQPDARTFALKLKYALENTPGSSRNRTLARYWDMAKSYNLESEIFGLRDILDDRDLGRLSQITPLERDIDEFEVSPKEARQDTPTVVYDIPSLELPAVRETEQKGMGLSVLKQSLAVFSEKPGPETSEEDPLYARQRRLESTALESARERWHLEHTKMAKMGITGNLTQGKLGALLWQWQDLMAKKIVKELELVAEAEAKTRVSPQEKVRIEYGPFLRQLSPEKIATVSIITMLQRITKSGASKSMKLAGLCVEMGKAIEDELDAEILDQKHKAERAKARKASKGPARSQKGEEATKSDPETPSSSAFRLQRHSLHHAARQHGVKRAWSPAVHTKVGAILCELVFDTAKIKVTKTDKVSGKSITIAQPILIRSMSFQNGKNIGMVGLHEDFISTLIQEPPSELLAKQLPMICPPRPWTGFTEGGYVRTNQSFVRVKNGEIAQRDYAQAAASRGDLDQLFAGVDVLGRTSWRINQNVLKIMLEAWNSGDDVANLAPLNKVFPKLERPPVDATPAQRYDWFTKARAQDNERGGLHSERCFQNFQMEIAKSFAKETFYLPHNVDFRGRAYPIPPYLNQMGADNARGILLFDKGRELGVEGLRWLKIHLSNVFGFDKANLADRAQFPMDHLDEIYDSVRNPLNGKRWWLRAEDPFQCLAACFELTAALDSPDPTKFVSRLPVHQDGSCNGLQHYAALGGDIAGAKQVNLEPGDKPADVYTGVCELVKDEIHKEALEGHEMAMKLDGKLTRKIVKQTVMTNVYGVTFLGAVRQVRRQIDDMIPELSNERLAGKAAAYIAKKIFQALGTMFNGAHNIQYWLGDCANRISMSISPTQLEVMYQKAYGKSEKDTPSSHKEKGAGKAMIDGSQFRSTVIWTTPLKLPVVQPYRINKGRFVKTNLQGLTLAQPSVADAVNKRKQLQAFPPNFIHSLDATHMILSALKADELGISFAAVHDSFWTHAADVNSLNSLLREAFIRMHSEDIIERLAAEFRMRYKGHFYLAQIDGNNPLAAAIQEYRATTGFPKKTGKNGLYHQRHFDLLREIRKQKLMESDDPDERAEGEMMVTAATLYKEYGGEQYLQHKDSLGETAIGAIPKNVNIIEEVLEAGPGPKIADVRGGTLNPLETPVTDDPAVTLDDLHFQAAQQKRAKEKSVWVWLPVEFRPVPEKGEFDVARLRASTYFFS